MDMTKPSAEELAGGGGPDIAMTEKKTTSTTFTTKNRELKQRDDNAEDAREDDERVSMASVRILDLRLLGQDEIRSIARLCGDVPARLRDLVRDLTINKSIFNESLGSRRQTFDRERERERERITRKRDHHHRHHQHHHHHQNESESQNLHQNENQTQKKRDEFLTLPSCSREALVSSKGNFLSSEANLASSNRDFSSSASLSGLTSLESFGVSSHRELILHLSQQLRVAEKNLRVGNGSLYQKENHASSEGCVRPVRMKSMARASSTPLNRVQDQDHNTHPLVPSSSTPLLLPSSTTTSVSANGKALAISATEILHRVSKKMKPKDEARRKASFIAVNSQPEDTITTESGRETDIEGAESQKEEKKLEFQLVMPTSLDMEEMVSKERTAHSGSLINMNAATTQCSNDQKSPETPLAKSEAFVHCAEPLTSVQNISPGKVSFFCLTCSKQFSNSYSLRRHAGSTGHKFDPSVMKSATPTPIVKKQQIGRCLCITCGNYYATPFTLKRHALAYGHSFEMSTLPVEQEHGEVKDEAEADVSVKNISLAKTKLESQWPHRSWKRKGQEFKSGKYQKRFAKKQQYIHDSNLHTGNTRKKLSRPLEKLLEGTVESSHDQVKDKPINISSRHQVEDVNEEDNDQFKNICQSEVLGRQISVCLEEVSVDKPHAMTCQDCGKVFNEYSRYTGHLGMHSRFRKLYTGETSRTNVGSSLSEACFDIDSNDLKKDMKESSALGFRRLISDTHGTFLSGLPAKLLFTGA